MEALWQDLSTRQQAGRLGQDEEKFFKKLVKALGYVSADPRRNSPSSHEISDLSAIPWISNHNCVEASR